MNSDAVRGAEHCADPDTEVSLAPRRGRWAGPLDPMITSRLFRTLWIVQAVSFFGTWMQAVGAQWYFVSYSPLLVALVPAASTLSTALFVLPGGVLADRVSRRTLLLVTYSAQSALLAGLAGLSLLHALSPFWLLLLTFSVGAVGAFAGPAYQAVQTEAVRPDQLRQSATLTIVSANIGKTVGPALAGVVISASGPGAVFALDAGCFVIATVLLLPIQLGPAEPVTAGFTAALRIGASYVRHDARARRALFWSAVILGLNAGLWALLPSYAHDHLGLGAAGYGGLIALVGVGAVLGALLLPRVRLSIPRNPLFAASAAVCGLTSVVVTMAGTAVTCAMLVVCGFAYVSIFAEFNSTMQMCLPREVRARGLSYYHLTANASIAIGSGVSGSLAGPIGTGTALLAFGVVLIAAAGLFTRMPFHDFASAGS